MSYGKAEKPCDNYKPWPNNGNTCGRCGWEKKEHSFSDDQKKRVYSIEVRGMGAGKQGVVKLMDGTHIFFMFSNELQKQFETEMKAAIDKK